jgi:acyl-CoA synthetase (AMP-forming)/AMP-acid ligase II
VRGPELEGVDLSGMRAFINCSEPVRADSHEAFVKRFAHVGARMDQMAVSYAMAENTFAVAQTPVGAPAHVDMIDREALQRDLRAVPVSPEHPHAAAQVSCGAPIAGTQVKVMLDDGMPASERQVGEIYVYSDCMLSGYYRRDDLHPFDADGWYRTGDRGYLAGGDVYIVGRSKDLIITAGKNVFPQDIEDAAYAVDGVHAGRAVAFGVPDAREGTELIALVAEIDPQHDSEAERARIFAALKREIARATEVTLGYVSLVPRGWLIKTSSGKIARGANRDKWLAERESHE